MSNINKDKPKIITLNEPTEAKQQDTPLTGQQAQAIGVAYARLMELREQSVLTPTLEAEVRGLVEFLSSELLEHANELLACWLAVKHEYEPALHLLARISGRVSNIRAAQVKPSTVIKPD